ncbi:hypothetical protein SDC9_125172 [bioreactor metagenome]|uniref:Uncharacterized protein n=1 Tax=bioreactor metagenome TaxID=1076179 RepID=A0A645CMI6_9ZZZZ
MADDDRIAVSKILGVIAVNKQGAEVVRLTVEYMVQIIDIVLALHNRIVNNRTIIDEPGDRIGVYFIERVKINHRLLKRRRFRAGFRRFLLHGRRRRYVRSGNFNEARIFAVALVVLRERIVYFICAYGYHHNEQRYDDPDYKPAFGGVFFILIFSILHRRLLSLSYRPAQAILP